MASGDDAARVVITGVGVVSPIGIGHASFWESLASGRGGIGELNSLPSASLPSRLAAEVIGFDPLEYLPSRKLLKVMSRDIQLGVAASWLAVDDAGLARGDLDPERIGVSFGAGRISSLPEDLSAAAGLVGFESESESDTDEVIDWTRWGEDSLGRIAPMWLLKRLPNMPACHVSIGLDARGPNNTITSRDTSSLLALAEGVRVIERGVADCMVVGASGSLLQPIDLVKLNLIHTLSPNHDTSSASCRPFDVDRDGTVPGEGGAAFVIERLDLARQRGATVYAEVLGCGAGCDGHPDEAGRAGEGLVNAITAALGDAGIAPDELGHVNAGATGLPDEDAVEARAIERALGEAVTTVPVTALAGYLGHSDAGGGAIELAGCLMTLRHRLVPVTHGFVSPDPGCRLDIVSGTTRPVSGPLALSCNRTEFGQSAAVVVRAG